MHVRARACDKEAIQNQKTNVFRGHTVRHTQRGTGTLLASVFNDDPSRARSLDDGDVDVDVDGSDSRVVVVVV